MLEPLNQFICDKCNQLIERPEDGWLEYITDPVTKQVHSFRIVHHRQASPSAEAQGCYHHEEEDGRSDDYLHNVLKIPILYLLPHLDAGRYHDRKGTGTKVSDMRNFTETFRRLTIPFYEEARFCWDEAIASGDFNSENEISLFKEETLRAVIEQYSKL